MFFGGGLLVVMAACASAANSEEDVIYDDPTTITQDFNKAPAYEYSREKFFKLLRKVVKKSQMPKFRNSEPNIESETEPRDYVIPMFPMRADSAIYLKNIAPKRTKPKPKTSNSHKKVRAPRRKWKINRPIKYCLLKICGPLSTYSYD